MSYPVQTHNDFASSLTTPSQVVRGGVNELSRRIITKCVNINSMFRETQAPTLWPQYKCMYDSKWSSSDFMIRLPTALDKVASMTLNSIEIPNTLYTFSSHFKTNVFTIVEIGSFNESVLGGVAQVSTPSPIPITPCSCQKKQQCGGCCSSACCNKQTTPTPSGYSHPNITYKQHIIEILPGNYDSQELIRQIQASIDNIQDLSGRIKVNMHPIYGRVYMYSPKKKKIKFNLDFRLPDEPTRDIRMNMGWILGYRNPYYFYEKSWADGCWYGQDYIDGSLNDSTIHILNPMQYNSKFVKRNYDSSMIAPAEMYNETDYNTNENTVTKHSNYLNGFISEGFIDTGGPRYLFLLVDDFNNNVNDQYMSLVSKNTLMPSSNILARIVLPQSKHEVGFDDRSDFVPKKREYFGPVRIDKLHFKLVDEFGRVVNLNNNEISLLLEFEVIYNL